ncbi:MAG: hypothetical protein JWM43_287 [Acidobacteriaceae bacterium]|nr:hypothetical protein [Acidobacteriaceae bacterium]
MRSTEKTAGFARPEILSPRTRRGGKMFDDEHLDILSHVLDDFIRIPGTSIRFGLDGIVGLIPGIGDALGGIASCVILVAAWVRGVPSPVLTRMVANVAIEVVVGTVPVLGDMFDIAWRANRRNYALLTGSVEQPRKVTRRSWWFLAGLCLFLMALVMVPTLLVAWLSVHVFAGLFQTK